MTDYGTLVNANTLRLERLLPGPIDRVWAYLTDPEKRATWLAGGPMATQKSGKVELVFMHKNLTPFEDDLPPAHHEGSCGDGHKMVGTVLAYDAPHRLSYTWQGPEEPDSEVTFELTPVGEKVRLTITHQRLHNKDEINSVSAGWHIHVDILAAKLAGETPARFWDSYHRLHEAYKKRQNS